MEQRITALEAQVKRQNEINRKIALSLAEQIKYNALVKSAIEKLNVLLPEK